MQTSPQAAAAGVQNGNWQPNHGSLGQICSLLQATMSPDNNVQKQVLIKVKEFKQNPEFARYLSFIIASCTSEQVGGLYSRFQAGVILKTIVSSRRWDALDAPTRAYVLAQCLQPRAMGDPEHNIRKTICNVVATIVRNQRSPPVFQAYPALLPSLVQMLSHANEDVVEGATVCLAMMCTDDVFRIRDHSSAPLNNIVPRFIQLSGHGRVRIRKGSMDGMVAILEADGSAAVDLMISEILAALAARARDPDSGVRCSVCRALGAIVIHKLPVFIESAQQIVQFFLAATADPVDSVALEACEFWSNFCLRCEEAHDALKPSLQKIIPAVMLRMVYSEEELASLVVEDINDSAVPDKKSDLRPLFHKARSGAARRSGPQDDDDDDVDGAGESSGEGRTNDDYALTWTLRKAASAALDNLCDTYGNDVLPHFLPPLKQLLSIQDPQQWLRLESGILALGCASQGCEQVQGYLDQLFPFLLTATGHQRPLIRKIALWTLSTFSEWICFTARKGGPAAVLQPTVSMLVQRMRDHTKCVQHAAVSAMGVLAENAEDAIVPFAEPILQTCCDCLKSYQEKNTAVLCDTLSAALMLCKDCPIVRQPAFLQMVMPPIVNRWNGISDNDDRRLVPLLEGLQSLAIALGPLFGNFAPPIFNRCLTIIETALMVVQSGVEGAEDFVDVEPMCVALDLVSALAEGLGSGFQPLVAGSNLIDLLPHICKFNDLDVLQSGFAVFGELCKACPSLLLPALQVLIPAVVNAMRCAAPSEHDDDDDEYEDEDDDIDNVCNNAIWSIGECALKIGPQVAAQFAPVVLNRLVYLLHAPKEQCKVPISVKMNSTITIGRLGLICPQAIAGRLAEYAKAMCLYMREMPADAEKEQAILGLCALVKANPQAVLNPPDTFGFVCHAFCHYDPDSDNPPAPHLLQEFKAVTQGFARNLGASWPQLVSSWPSQLQQQVQQTLLS